MCGIVNMKWRAFFSEASEQITAEFGDHTLSSSTLVDWLYEYARTLRARPPSGLYLGTVHASKGLEFRHVMLLDGGWSLSADNIEQERRLYYVGMTRAQQTLTLCRHAGGKSFVDTLDGSVQHQSCDSAHAPSLDIRYQTVSLKEVDIGYSGSHGPPHHIHTSIAALREGDTLKLLPMQGRYLLTDAEGNIVGRMAASFKPNIKDAQCSVAGVVVRYRRDGNHDKQFAGRLKCDKWEVVVPRMIGH